MFVFLSIGYILDKREDTMINRQQAIRGKVVMSLRRFTNIACRPGESHALFVTAIIVVAPFIGCGQSGQATTPQSGEASPSARLYLPAPLAQPAAQSQAQWEAAMPTPPKSGCFKAQYPSLEWQEVPCVAVPNIPTRAPGSLPVPKGRTSSMAGGVGPMYAGGGAFEYLADVGSDSISVAEGSFSRVAGVTSVTDNTDDSRDGGVLTPNYWTLQMNTNSFPTPEWCAGCTGWQQFAYRNNDTSGVVWIENWLFGYGSVCPDSTWYYSPDAGSCIRDSPGVAVPGQTVADLPRIRLKGWAYFYDGTTHYDRAFFTSGGGTMYTMSQGYNVLYLTNKWKSVEYNILGWGNGSCAHFNPGSSIIVKIDLWPNGPTFVPTCTGNGSGWNGETAEWNNLTLAAPCCPLAANPLLTAPRPGITFAESNVVGAQPAFCVTWDQVPILSLLR